MTKTTRSLSPQIRRWLSIFVITVITILMLAWAARGVSFGHIVESWQLAQPGWLVLGLAIFLASYLVRAKRWGTLLGVQRNSGSFSSRLSAIFVGFACNSILPGRIGELVRALMLHRRSKVPLGSSVGSIFTARLLDALVAFILLLASLLVIARSDATSLADLPLKSITFVLISCCTVFLIAAWYPKLIVQLVEIICPKIGLGRWQSQLVGIVNSVLAGLEVFKYPGRSLVALLETFCIWGMMGATFWFCAIAFGIVTPGYIGSLFVQSVVALAIVVPSSPGYLGTFEAGIRFGLEVYPIDPGVIVAYAITLHLLMNASLVIVGLAIAIKQGISWQDLIAVKSSAAKSNDSQLSPPDINPK